MKAVIFTLVTSAGQEDGVSLDAQEAKLLDYCREKSLDILETFRVVESSIRGDRKQFFKALSLIEKQKKRTVLLVHSIDRLLRGFKEYGLIEQDKLKPPELQMCSSLGEYRGGKAILRFFENAFLPS